MKTRPINDFPCFFFLRTSAGAFLLMPSSHQLIFYFYTTSFA
ncbi:Uncharacterized protein dnm_019310 [Desulfonema magnum]|uniref:Uncharacterized protein n=1 Tax=Desulfonema magnum TaxID=45655 RepID=A0A975BIT1_9BACT|nr:Uncharacterized protein dnm_019310 [Desulfonema magnum]